MYKNKNLENGNMFYSGYQIYDFVHHVFLKNYGFISFGLKSVLHSTNKVSVSIIIISFETFI
jgi:hypothetical protein